MNNAGQCPEPGALYGHIFGGLYSMADSRCRRCGERADVVDQRSRDWSQGRGMRC